MAWTMGPLSRSGEVVGTQADVAPTTTVHTPTTPRTETISLSNTSWLEVHSQFANFSQQLQNNCYGKLCVQSVDLYLLPHNIHHHTIVTKQK